MKKYHAEEIVNTSQPFLHEPVFSNTQLCFIIAFYKVTKTTEAK